MKKSRITRPPFLLENFEDARVDAQGAGRRWGSMGEKTYASVELVDRQSHPDIIRSGKKALKFNYDFRFETTEGGSRRAYFNTYGGENSHIKADLEVVKNDPNILVIPDGEYPSHLGMWVYGDNNDAWFNGMLIDSEGIDFEVTCGDQDWVGWKFIKMDIPPNLKLPFYIIYPARLLTGNQTIHGSLFIGEIMALYGGIDFDALEPEINNFTCKEDSDQIGYPEISIKLEDPYDGDNEIDPSGIDAERTEIYIDSVRHKNSISFDIKDNKADLNFKPDFALCGGSHRFDIKAFDKAGNSRQESFFFDLLAPSPRLEQSLKGEAELGSLLEISYKLIGAKPFHKLSLELGFDSELLNPWQEISESAPAVSAKLVKTENALKLEFDTGKAQGDLELGRLCFKVVDDLTKATKTKIHCLKAVLDFGEGSQAFCPADYNLEIKPSFEFKLERFCKGYETLIKVQDLEGKPVAGAQMGERDSSLVYPGQTDQAGQLTLPLTSELEVGDKLDLYAFKDNLFSLTERHFVCRDLRVTDYPANINLVCGADCRTAAISWQTGLEITTGALRYALKEEGKESLDDSDSLLEAQRENHFNSYRDDPCEMNGFAVRLESLKPGAQYLYQIKYGDTWTEVKSFKTIPDKGDFVFAILADTHNRCGPALEAALKCEPDLDFLAHAGDFVSAGVVYDDWLELFEDSRDLFQNYISVTTPGNHDLSDGTGANYRMIYKNPANGLEGAPQGLFFYTELNNTLIVSVGGGYEDEEDIAQWVSEIVQKTKMKWKILLTHEGPYTCFINSAEDEYRIGEFTGNVGIDMLLSGHDHTYHRATIKDHKTLDVKDKISSADGVTYIPCGCSGGTGNHDWSVHRSIWNAVYDSPTPMVSLFYVSDEKIESIAIRVADNEKGYEIVDRFELTK